MPDTADQKPNLPPPQGEKDQAEKYLDKLANLIIHNKIQVSHTDLKKFDLTSLQDHYTIPLDGYEVEVSHTKQPDTGKDFFVMLFNNIRMVQADGASCIDKLILAYIHLTEEQFRKFKRVADDQLERKRREEEAQRFEEAMTPVDSLLSRFAENSAKPSFQTNNQEQRPQATPAPVNNFSDNF